MKDDKKPEWQRKWEGRGNPYYGDTAYTTSSGKGGRFGVGSDVYTTERDGVTVKDHRPVGAAVGGRKGRKGETDFGNARYEAQHGTN